MTKIVILDQKLFVPNDYQQFEWFYHIFKCKIATFTVQAKSMQKTVLFGL